MLVSHQYESSKKLISLKKQENVDFTSTTDLKHVDFTERNSKLLFLRQRKRSKKVIRLKVTVDLQGAIFVQNIFSHKIQDFYII